jgi:hypothetical protein
LRELGHLGQQALRLGPAEGGAKVVWVDYPKRKSAPLPERVRRAIVTPLLSAPMP